MAGSNPFSIEASENFQRSFKKLAKIYKEGFSEIIVEALEGLINEQYPINSRQEPLPSKIRIPEGWTFHKLEIKVGRGASGQLRLMYLVNENLCLVRLVWLYSHEQFAKRPTDKDLKGVIEAILDS